MHICCKHIFSIINENCRHVQRLAGCVTYVSNCFLSPSVCKLVAAPAHTASAIEKMEIIKLSWIFRTQTDVRLNGEIPPLDAHTIIT